MFEKVMNYKPQEQDYRIWMVVNPSTWLIPIMLSLLILAIAVHAAVFSIVPEGMLFVNDSAPVAAVVEEAAAAVEEAVE